MKRSLSNKTDSRAARRGYALLLVVVVLAGLSVLIGVVGRLAAAAAREHRNASQLRAARWAADAAVEEAIWRWAHRDADGAPGGERFTTGSNGCSVDVSIIPAAPGRLGVRAQARAMAEDIEPANTVAGLAVMAVIEFDPAARALRIISWSEGPAADSSKPPGVP